MRAASTLACVVLPSVVFVATLLLGHGLPGPGRLRQQAAHLDAVVPHHRHPPAGLLLRGRERRVDRIHAARARAGALALALGTLAGGVAYAWPAPGYS